MKRASKLQISSWLTLWNTKPAKMTFCRLTKLLLSEDSSTSECDRAAVAQQDRQLVQAWNDGNNAPKSWTRLLMVKMKRLTFSTACLGGYTRQFVYWFPSNPIATSTSHWSLSADGTYRINPASWYRKWSSTIFSHPADFLRYLPHLLR